MNEEEILRHLVGGAKAAGAQSASQAAEYLERRGLIRRIPRPGGILFDPPRWEVTEAGRRLVERAHAHETGVG